jgi:hypothetical protein
MPRKPNPKPIRIVKVGNEYQTFAMMLRPGGEHRHLTARELTAEFEMSYSSLLIREENPSLLTIGDVYRLARLRKESVDVVMGHLIREIQELPPELHPLTEPERQQGVGRPKLLRKPGVVAKKLPRPVRAPEDPQLRQAKRVPRAKTLEEAMSPPPELKAKPKERKPPKKKVDMTDKMIDRRRRKKD